MTKKVFIIATVFMLLSSSVLVSSRIALVASEESASQQNNPNGYESVWNYTADLSPWDDEVMGIAIDSSNNIIASGFGRNTSMTDGYWSIMKLDKEGKSIWNFTYDGPILRGDDEAVGVAVDDQDDFVVAGFEKVSSLQNYSWRIMKFDNSIIPNQIWNITYNITLNIDKPEDLAIDNDNNIVVVGYYQNNASDMDFGWHIVKFGSDGTFLWNRSFNFSSYDDLAYGVATDSDNNIVVVGYDSSISSDNRQWRLMKLDRYGNSLWNRTEDFSPNADKAYGVAIDHDNNIIGFGYSNGTSGDGMNGQWRVVKFDSNGGILWNIAKDLSPSWDNARNAAVDSDNNILVVGYVNSNDTEWKIMKLSHDGLDLWEYSFNPSNSTDQVKAVAIDHNGDMIIGGYDRLPGWGQWRILKFSRIPPTIPLWMQSWFWAAIAVVLVVSVSGGYFLVKKKRPQ